MLVARINCFARINTSIPSQNFGKKKSDITDYGFVEDRIALLKEKLATEKRHLEIVKGELCCTQSGNKYDELKNIISEITDKIVELNIRLEKYNQLKTNLEAKLGLIAKQ